VPRDEFREQMTELAAGYVLGNLSPEEAEALQQYTREHPEFAIEIDRLYDLLGILPYGLPAEAPPQELRDRILVALPDRAAPSASPSASPFTAPQPTFHQHARPKSALRVISWPWPIATRTPWFAPAAAAVAIVLGVTTWQTQRTLVNARSQLAIARDRADRLELALDRFTARDLPVLQPDAALVGSWQLDRLAEDHRRAVNQASIGKTVSASKIDAIVREFADEFDFAPRLPVLDAPGVRLVSGTFCRLGKTAGFRFTYETEDGRSLSLYQIGTPDDSLPLPDVSGGSIYIYQAGRPEILLWSHGGFDYALVAEMPRDRLTALSAVRYEIVTR